MIAVVVDRPKQQLVTWYVNGNYFRRVREDLLLGIYLVAAQMINNAREVDISALGDDVIFQGGQELRLGLSYLTCNKTKDNCIDLPTR